MAKGNEGLSSSSKVVVLVVSPKQRFANLFLTFMSVMLISAVIAWNSLKANRADPINVELFASVLGGLLLLLPLSEHWAYRPWQDAPRKMEHETCD